MRAFLGLPVPEAWLDPLLDMQERLPVGREVAEENLHLTLAFLDDQPERALEALHEGLAARRLGRCALRATGIGALGERKPRAVALEVARVPGLEALHAAALAAARGAGIDLARRRFRPHVTLARLGALGEAEAARLAAALARMPAPPAEAEAERMVLWRSTLRPEGATYDALAEYPLA